MIDSVSFRYNELNRGLDVVFYEGAASDCINIFLGDARELNGFELQRRIDNEIMKNEYLRGIIGSDSVDMVYNEVIKYVRGKLLLPNPKEQRTPVDTQVSEALEIMELAKNNQRKAIQLIDEVNEKKRKYYLKYGNIIDKIFSMFTRK